MSSILKALKKLEDENNARTPDSLKINAEILRGGDASRISTTSIVLAALLLFLGGGAATYLVMQPGAERSTGAAPSPAESSVPAGKAPSVPARPSPPAAPVEPPRQSPAQLPHPAEKTVQSPMGPTAAKKSVRNEPLPRMSVTPRGPLAPAAASQPEPADPPMVPARPIVRVNGIAYQDGADSVAVINGVPVSRGALVEGVRIDEIERDRVRFSFGGEKFEVLLGKSNQ